MDTWEHEVSGRRGPFGTRVATVRIESPDWDTATAFVNGREGSNVGGARLSRKRTFRGETSLSDAERWADDMATAFVFGGDA